MEHILNTGVAACIFGVLNATDRSFQVVDEQVQVVGVLKHLGIDGFFNLSSTPCEDQVPVYFKLGLVVQHPPGLQRKRSALWWQSPYRDVDAYIKLFLLGGMKQKANTIE